MQDLDRADRIKGRVSNALWASAHQESKGLGADFDRDMRIISAERKVTAIPAILMARRIAVPPVLQPISSTRLTRFNRAATSHSSASSAATSLSWHAVFCLAMRSQNLLPPF